jgi:hypothetical protein
MHIGLAASSRRQADVRRAVARMESFRQQGILSQADVVELEGRLRALVR